MSIEPDERPLVLVVDDEPANLQLMRRILNRDYRLLFARDGQRALELAQSEKPDIVLLDVMMPGMTGHEVCRRLKSLPQTARIPVLFVTALTDPDDELAGFAAGAVDYLNKPVSPAIVLARLRTHLSLVDLDELERTCLAIVQRLGRAAEFKDNETGYHVIRMSHYASILGRAAGLTERAAKDLLNAAPMHDIGKIGIPDSILTKPGKLTAEEWAVMQTHPTIGGEIIGDHDDRMLTMARVVALSHHEKWDGSGYPEGLAGEDIPLEGRIVAVADVFDALATKRPYKHAWTIEETVGYIRAESGKHFDPAIVALLEPCLPEMLAVKERWAERE
ncbi:MAG TPA: two-component system response regulator [Xanthomonadaceae bacterium]|jgi:putative two-component system response regulator